MKRMALFLTLSFWGIIAYGQEQGHSLSYYVEVAKRNSPLLNDYRNQILVEQDELQRLEAMYCRSRLEVNGITCSYRLFPKTEDGLLFNGMHVMPLTIMDMTLAKAVDFSMRV